MKMTEYAIKQMSDRHYPIMIDRDAGGHYEIKNPLTDGMLSYNTAWLLWRPCGWRRMQSLR